MPRIYNGRTSGSYFVYPFNARWTDPPLDGLTCLPAEFAGAAVTQYPW
jgi:hypothetical protein